MRVFHKPFYVPFEDTGKSIARMMIFNSDNFSSVSINGWSFAYSSDFEGGPHRFLGAGIRREY